MWGFWVLAAGNAPNFRTTSRISASFTWLRWPGCLLKETKIVLEAGALKLGAGGLDGTKMKANASKHKAMSYGRMKERERQLRAEGGGGGVNPLAQAEAADAAEDAHYGVDRRGDELPAEFCSGARAG